MAGKIGGIKMNNDIRKLIDDNWEDIKELIAQKAEAEQKPKTIWDLKIEDSEKYYCIDSDGAIVQHMFDESFDEVNRDLGNAFLTWKEAKFERERRKIEAIMRKYSRPFKNNRNNYCLYLHNCKIILIGNLWAFNPGIPCFESKEIAQRVINEIREDELKRYWFGVEGGK